MSRAVDEKFYTFISSILSGPGNVKDEAIKKLLTPKAMQKFKMAFVSKLSDRYNNYELAEFVGDGMLHAYVAKFIVTRFPQIKNPDWTTRLTQFLSKSKTLGSLAYQSGFHSFAQIPNDIPRDLKDNTFADTMEDIFEAFIGTVVTVFDESYPDGVGYAVAKNIAFHYFYKVDIPLNREGLWDPVTRLKELYEKYRWPDQPKDIYRLFYDKSSGKTTIQVWGWPTGNVFSRETAVKVAEVTADVRDRDKKVAKKKQSMLKESVSKEAIEFFLKRGFAEKIVHPGKRD